MSVDRLLRPPPSRRRRQRSRPQPNRPPRRPFLAVVLHVVHQPVPQLERLVLAANLAAAVHPPAERDDHADLTGGHDVGFGVGDLQPWLDARARLTTLSTSSGVGVTVSTVSLRPPDRRLDTGG